MLIALILTKSQHIYYFNNLLTRENYLTNLGVNA